MNIFLKWLAVSCVAVSSFSAVAQPFSATAKNPGVPQTAAAENPMQFFNDLRGALKINGASQEQAWNTFVRGGQTNVDMSAFQEMARAKTTPELMNWLEKMQVQAAQRIIEQKRTVLGLYEVLNADQRATFDTFMFSTMGQLGSTGR